MVDVSTAYFLLESLLQSSYSILETDLCCVVCILMVRTKQTTKPSSLKALKVKKDAANRDHPGSVISFQSIDKIRDSYSFPPSWIVETTDLYDNLQCPAFVPKGSFAIYEFTMQLGLHFPLPKFASLFLKENNLAPFQLHPKGWANLMAFHVLSFLKGVSPSLFLFQCFF